MFIMNNLMEKVKLHNALFL